MLIHSNIGNAPWVVLAEGVSRKLDLSIGGATFFISLIVLLIWIPLKQKPGVGTLMNSIIISLVMDLSTSILNISSPHFLINFLIVLIGILLAGIGSGIYLIANLGPGPRDGLMTGIQKNSRYPISVIRILVETSVVFIGFILGGTVGIATMLFAVGIGPSVALGLKIVKLINSMKE
tara:strand:+ start:491 stop:1021 length:531 start_codon:yes stop_codon:yes gene_type:complete